MSGNPDNRTRKGRRRQHLRRIHRRSWGIASALLFSLLLCIAVLAVTERRIALPETLTDRIEARVDEALAPVAVSMGRISVGLDRHILPRLWLENVAIRTAEGLPLLEVREIGAAFDPAAAIRGRVAPRDLAGEGVTLSLRRDAEGAFELPFALEGGPRDGGLGALLDTVDAAMEAAPFDRLEAVRIDGGTVTLEDARAAQVLQAVDTRIALARTPEGTRLTLAADLFEGNDTASRVDLALATRRADSGATLSARLDDVTAESIAAQAPVLGFLSVLDAPLSGRLAAHLDAQGALADLSGSLEIGAGAIQPRRATRPIPFESARAALDYDAATARLTFAEISARSSLGALRLSGHADLGDFGDTGVPASLVGQFAIEDVAIEAPDLFENAVRAQDGSLDMRLRLDPFEVEIGELVLPDPEGRRERHLRASGRISASAEGWRVGVDLATERLSVERLRALWPLPVAPGPRRWVAENLKEGRIDGPRLALRFVPGDEKPRLSASFAFAETRARILRTLPPLTGMAGFGSIGENRFAVALDAGVVTMPGRAPLDLAGTTMTIPDTRIKPSPARFDLRTTGSLPALLAVLDADPFKLLNRVGRDPDLGTGEVTLRTDLELPLKPGLTPDDIAVSARGTVRDLASDTVVAGRELRAEEMAITADLDLIRAEGAATLDGVAFDGSWQQVLRGDDRGQGSVEGRVALSPEGLARFGVALPDGYVSGSGEGDLSLDLAPDVPPRLTLTTDLRGVALRIAAVDWSKAAATPASLTVGGTLGAVPDIDTLRLEAPGLSAQGRVELGPGPRFEALALDRVVLGSWLDAGVTISARGRGAAPAITVRGGEIDIRTARLGAGGGSAGGGTRGPVALRLDRLVVTDTVALSNFAVDLAPGRTLAGRFEGRVNGGQTVTGRIEGGPRGATISLGSGNAGALLRDAGLVRRVEGGALALTLTPTGDRGSYDGRLRVSNTRLRDAPAIAEILSAASVVGLVEQLQGQGIVFDEVEADFRLTPSRITLYNSSATGASMGISMDGVYDPVARTMDMQGVLSPLYVVNRIGSLFTRRGEGLFGVTFTLRGPVAQPAVGVNPLSLLTPGAFRDIFRRDPPRRPAR
ncbi:AsmA-like protein [Palleronia aestuarii]|uniref:AsmA-like protein n=1 Tax=Palleronia aestuarii TaxID=568105 RepID=A0A2W7N7I0_9RHOB|nr:AsmA-like C-terminal region-containing protein [Palleronia aestuarii]PZX16020.1 AsmA-like protein [Palleronia aestuarii]